MQLGDIYRNLAFTGPNGALPPGGGVSSRKHPGQGRSRILTTKAKAAKPVRADLFVVCPGKRNTKRRPGAASSDDVDPPGLVKRGKRGKRGRA